ncbi:MAG TPA: radical SAM protein [Thermomicrobiales bacterium]|nr:radical SAM protein [Thermomicrobiales bacterium]
MDVPVFSYILLKLSSRCNLNCTYCYWFRDASVYEQPPLLTVAAERAFLDRLTAHIRDHGLRRFSILFHGGEPLMFGKKRFLGLMQGIARVHRETGCDFRLSMTTNGVLLDEEWAAMLKLFGITVTVSIDGPQATHDAARVDLRGRGSYARAVRGLRLLQDVGVEPTVLSVCDPAADPDAVVAHIVDELGIRHFDILIPDATHEDEMPSIRGFYNRLFDLWFETYAERGIGVRFPKSMLVGLLGGEAHSEAIGYGPIQTLTLLPDGSLEPLDVLRITGDASTRTGINVFEHTFQDVTSNPVWRRAFEASLSLSETCRGCEYRRACGGGYLPHRWSSARGFDNPSVYCDDLQAMFGHIWDTVSPRLSLVTPAGSIPLSEAVLAGADG